MLLLSMKNMSFTNKPEVLQTHLTALMNLEIRLLTLFFAGTRQEELLQHMERMSGIFIPTPYQSPEHT